MDTSQVDNAPPGWETPTGGGMEMLEISVRNPELSGKALAELTSTLPAGVRIVALRRPGAGVEVHAIDCLQLASGVDADWIDLSWGDHSKGAVGRLEVTLYNRPGTLAEMAGVFAKANANVMNLELTERDDPFHTYVADLEVGDLAHLTRIVSALRASDAVAQAERL